MAPRIGPIQGGPAGGEGHPDQEGADKTGRLVLQLNPLSPKRTKMKRPLTWTPKRNINNPPTREIQIRLSRMNE